MIRFQTNVGHLTDEVNPDSWLWTEGQVVDLPDASVFRDHTYIEAFTRQWAVGRGDPAPASYRTVVIAQDAAGDFTDIVTDVTYTPDPV